MRLEDLDTLQAGDLLHYSYMPDNRLFGPVSRVYRVVSVQTNVSGGAKLNCESVGRESNGDSVHLWLWEFDGTMDKVLPNLSKLDSSIASRITVGA